ncbi:hypothetical protein BT93_G0323 [Corymbia citriodora subsp. variegata]|nr:hypothetical protein BT93_G0323 [Corymbia citriodora subsp. variegata]KAF8019599.1 hypothetical protein BT93_G0323 [Corymbia citriodora subsp. variegata]
MAPVIIPQHLPIGYRFHPTDEEFVAHYLTNRVLGIIDDPCIIPDVDICRWDPWELPHKFYGESIIRPDDRVQEWWFFCLQIHQQVKRTTPSGYWKETGADRNVKARDVEIATKKTLVFHIREGSVGIKTNWVIHEYHLLTKDLNRNYVLCRIKLKGEHGSASNSPRKTNSRENEPAGEKSNSVTASTGPSTKNTKSSANPPLRNFVNLLVGVLLLIAITYLHFPRI